MSVIRVGFLSIIIKYLYIVRFKILRTENYLQLHNFLPVLRVLGWYVSVTVGYDETVVVVGLAIKLVV